MASFNGVSIFGVAVTMTDIEEAAGYQEQGYPGLNGVEAIALGGRARRTQVTGILTAANNSALATLIAVYRAFEEAALPYTLVNTRGETSLYCVMQGFKTVDRIEPYTGGVAQKYQVSFRHLT